VKELLAKRVGEQLNNRTIEQRMKKWWIPERKNSPPGKNSIGTNGLISFSGESAEKPAKTK
jgi:hypothetical protein